MSRKKKQPITKTWSEIFLSRRRDWGDIDPRPRIIPNKKKDRDKKEKFKYDEEE